MKNFHVPLPEAIHAQLRAAAERAQIPAITLVHEAMGAYLLDQARRARRREIMAYAAEMAGTEIDPDRTLELASIEHLAKTDGEPE